MTSEPSPVSLSDLPRWQSANRVSSGEARNRLAQFVVLDCIAGSSLAGEMAFKGGNALRFVYQNRRSTIDLDFSSVAGFPDDESVIRNSLGVALEAAAGRHGIRIRCQSVRRNPKGTVGHHFPTYQITLGFAFPGERHFINFDADPRPLPTIVELEISLNEMICETVEVPLGEDSSRRLQVCSLEDIIAEKLRSLLQQPIRNRTRKQDVLDIATVWRRHAANLDIAKMSDFLLRKCSSRKVIAEKSKFNEEIRIRALTDYDQLRTDAGDSFIPFDEAWQTVLALVRQLTIPD